MAAERDLELLDNYLSNRLDAQGRAEFEQMLQKDPGLKSEFELQQQFVSGIRKARAAELKSLLNNIAIPPASTGTAIGAKAAMWVVIAGLVGTGLYFYLDQKTDAPSAGDEVELQQEKKINAEESTENPADVNKTEDEEPVVSDEPAASENKAVPLPKASKKANVKPSPALDVYDPTKDASENKTEGEDSKLVIEPASSPTVEINTEDKKSFHYQFTNGKVILYGPFEKNLYEILEFFDGDKRTVFLYYRNQFYHLKDDSDQIRSLMAVKDQALLKKLKESRIK